MTGQGEKYISQSALFQLSIFVTIIAFLNLSTCTNFEGTQIEEPTQVLITVPSDISDTKTMTPTSTPTTLHTQPPPASAATPTPTRRIGISEKDGMVMVNVPAGEFEMGGSTYNNSPIHTVFLSSYWIDQTEISNEMYAICVSDGMCNLPVSRGSFTRELYFDSPDYSNYPVIHVTWNDATNYCDWAGRRLPTEAEWEKAASWDAENQQKNHFPWGTMDGPISNFANLCDINCPNDFFQGDVDDGYVETAPVDSFPNGASPYGALNMSGNVWEWVVDWYDANYYTTSPTENPTGPAIGNERVLRGGAWDYMGSGSYLSTPSRHREIPSYESSSIGFRCARDANP